LEGEKAKKMRSTKMKTGTRRSIKGGGGRGGNTTGSTKMDKVRRKKTIIRTLTCMYFSFKLATYTINYGVSMNRNLGQTLSFVSPQLMLEGKNCE
jgi:hypothetical protein